MLSHVWFFVTPWTAARQYLLSMGFSRQEYWSELPCLPPGALPNTCLLHCRQILYHLSHQGSPRILKWVAYPFSRGTSQPKDWTQVSCTAGRFFTSWATREAQEYWSGEPIPSPEDLPDPGIKPGSPALPVDSLPTELSVKPCLKQWSLSIWYFWCKVSHEIKDTCWLGSEHM